MPWGMMIPDDRPGDVKTTGLQQSERALALLRPLDVSQRRVALTLATAEQAYGTELLVAGRHSEARDALECASARFQNLDGCGESQAFCEMGLYGIFVSLGETVAAARHQKRAHCCEHGHLICISSATRYD